MKTRFLAFIVLALAAAWGAAPSPGIGAGPAVSSPLEFRSSHAALDAAFAWAKAQALAYVFTGDPVGDWYEAALPNRAAFCMRDVSHQAAGANALGLAAFNKNMFRKFAANISESKDWCTYWEINKFDKPAPVDYRNDKEFWYNLPANFDVLDAVGRQFLWTGDRAYLNDPIFLNYCERTVRNYVDRWDLDPTRIMSRPAHMNLAVPLDPRDPYRDSRGLPSYNEDESGLNVGADLPAAQYAAYRAYAMLLGSRGDARQAQAWGKKAIELKAFFHKTWWDPAAGRYAVFHYPDGRFARGIGQEFLLYYGITADGAPTSQALRETLERSDINIEMRSYYPEIFFRLGEGAAALRTILYLCDPSTRRREYPEVSYAVIGALAGGLMGLSPDARDGSVTTLSRLPKDVRWAEMKNIPVLGTSVAVKHLSLTRTEFSNTGERPVVWKAAFAGAHDSIQIDGRPVKAVRAKGGDSREYSIALVPLAAGRSAAASIEDKRN